MSSLTKEQFDFVQCVAQRNGFKNVEIQTTGGTIKGDGYLGVVHFITVKERDGDKELNLVLKASHKSPEIRKQMSLKKVYLREAYMYETVFPTLVSFQSKIGIKNPFKSVAKMYGALTTDTHESVLLENLNISGYKLWNRKLPMDAEHVELVCREYGKYHAASFALKTMYPEKYAELNEELTDIFEDFTMFQDEILEKTIDRMFKRGYDALGEHPTKKDLKKCENEATQFYRTNFFNTEEKFSVVLHGDCWCNNMMFKYEDTENPLRPTTMCFLDFQLSKPGTPVYDLSYFLYVCAPKSILLDLDKYLNIYHETLSKNLQDCGCDPQKVFPMNILKAHWKKYSIFGLLCALSLLPFMMSDAEDIPDISQSIDDGKQLMDTFIGSTVSDDVEDACKKRLFDLITFMADRKFL